VLSPTLDDGAVAAETLDAGRIVENDGPDVATVVVVVGADVGGDVETPTSEEQPTRTTTAAHSRHVHRAKRAFIIDFIRRTANADRSMLSPVTVTPLPHN